MEAVIVTVLVAVIIICLVLGVRWERRNKRSTGERISDWIASLWPFLH